MRFFYAYQPFTETVRLSGDSCLLLNCVLILACVVLKFAMLCTPQVFLEPLAQVVGSSRSKSLLLEACSVQATGSNASPTVQQMELARLGYMLGIQEWTRPLTDTFTFPPECITVVTPQQPAPRDELLGDDDEEEEEEEVMSLSTFVTVVVFVYLFLHFSSQPLPTTPPLPPSPPP